MFSEITQKNKLEILGKLTASLSHELRNPLSAIKLNLEYMNMSSEELPEDIKDSLANCMEGVSRIESLIENILSFSRKPKGSQEPVSVNEITKTAVDLTLAKANKSKIKIDIQLSKKLPSVIFSRGNLLQVFINLITNAIEACEGKGNKVIIKSYVDRSSGKDCVIWEIEDNGVGIKDEDKQKIFGEFFTNKNRGTGIGLTVCQSLLEEKGAKLNLESQYGKGTKFIVAFNNDTNRNER
jgi:signal transduction histidine kinase